MTIEQEAREIVGLMTLGFKSGGKHTGLCLMMQDGGRVEDAIAKALKAKQDRIDVLEGALREISCATYSSFEHSYKALCKGMVLIAKKALGGGE